MALSVGIVGITRSELLSYKLEKKLKKLSRAVDFSVSSIEYSTGNVMVNIKNYNITVKEIEFNQTNQSS